ncbi:hypothetical protein [Croceibacter atlanticus]|jgi:hypothetical protein|uniref:hypothetical protein n=1 Tax=Croceibacter atlanticus TaxID=313588 RepID=UPI0030F635F3
MIKSIENNFKNFIYKPNPNPILIFGFPKSGTSAIAYLLSIRTNKSLTSDTKYLWEPYISNIKNESIDLKAHINKYSYPFSKDIIKEPNMVFIVEKILNIYKNPKILIIEREKLSNIRSILNRLKLPGDLKENPKINSVNKNWRAFIFKQNNHYIDVLNNHYLESQKNLQLLKEFNPVYIKYEDFCKNKIGEIDRISTELNLKIKCEINDFLNVQYQPKGLVNSTNSDFFGENIVKLF